MMRDDHPRRDPKVDLLEVLEALETENDDLKIKARLNRNKHHTLRLQYETLMSEISNKLDRLIEEIHTQKE